MRARRSARTLRGVIGGAWDLVVRSERGTAGRRSVLLNGRVMRVRDVGDERSLFRTNASGRASSRVGLPVTKSRVRARCFVRGTRRRGFISSCAPPFEVASGSEPRAFHFVDSHGASSARASAPRSQCDCLCVTPRILEEGAAQPPAIALLRIPCSRVAAPVHLLPDTNLYFPCNFLGS